MKTKLTVTIDRDILPAAKRYARSRGASLSSVIEAALREMVDTDRPRFADRWRGAFSLSQEDDDRTRALIAKYS
jgi:hypothetical protein